MQEQRKRPIILPKKPVSDAISLDNVYHLGQKIGNTQIRIIYYVLYLSGARITEALTMRIKDIQFNISESGNNLIIFNLITEKHRSHPLRTIPACYISKDKPYLFTYEKKMVDEIRDYVISKSINETSGNELLFKISRIQVWRVFTKSMVIVLDATHPVTGKRIENYEKKINPHFLRHCRLTHLRTLYGADAVTLMQFAGWSNMNMCRTYLHLGYKELAKMFD